MSALTLLAIYFLVWWMVLFAVLPWGATSAHERGGAIEPGHAPSAPLQTYIVRKLIATTVIAGVVMAVASLVVRSGWLTLESFSILP